MNFYNLERGNDGSHYLLENGQLIARFGELAAAEAIRESFCRELIERVEVRLEGDLE